MPALNPVASVVRVNLKGTNNGTNWQNVLHLQYSGSAPSTSDLTSIATAVANAWNTNFAPMCGAQVSLTEVDTADLTSSTAATQQTTVSHAGSRGGTALPSSVACVVSWAINHRYRGGHPRSYLPAGMIADVLTGHLWQAAFITAMESAAAAFLTALNAITFAGSTCRMVSVQYVSAKTRLSVPVPYTINASTVHGRVDTQRKRLGKETP